MKESLIKIKNKIKGFTPFKKISPHIHWRNLLYVFFVIMIVLIVFSFYLLYQIKNQQIFQVTSSSTGLSSLINEKLLEKVNESFGVKLIKTKEIEDGLTTYKDPSVN